MRRHIYLLFCLATVPFVGLHAKVGQTNSATTANPDDEALIRRIQAGDAAAMTEAGRSGNRLFIPFLRLQLKNWNKHIDTAGPAGFALARLGETDQLQEVWCRAITDDPKRGLENPVFELEQVGGWFSIQGLEKLLTPEGLVHWHKLGGKEKYSDATVDPLNVRALRTLPKVVPNPPVRYSAPTEQFRAQTHTQEEMKMWQDWIAAHKDELSKLQPTGEGVDFSDSACKNGKPRKKLG